MQQPDVVATVERLGGVATQALLLEVFTRDDISTAVEAGRTAWC